jgi:DNA (cytosine-5)-methyltransferase 1
MVRAGLGSRWKCQFANDFDPLKVQVYADNWGEQEILEDDIHKVGAVRVRTSVTSSLVAPRTNFD